MNCPECLDLLQQDLDGTEPADRNALEAHLAGCPDCRAWFGAAQRLREGLRAQTIPLAPANLTERMVHAVLVRYRRRVRLRRWVAAGAAVAAAVLIALWATRPGPDSPGLALLPYHLEPKPKEEPKSLEAPSLERSVDEARSAVAALTDDLATKTRAQVRGLWTVAAPLAPSAAPGLAAASALEQPFEPATQSLRESGRGVSVSLAAVTDSARRAVSYFLRELPPLQHEKKTGL